ncbi:MAG: ATP-dependent 6-phosphofructokinase [Planctomycetota bacterium]
MRIGVFCSGGDAPGMNACVRAVVRAGIWHGHEIVGIKRGYQGLLNEEFYINHRGEPLLTLRRVEDWTNYGGAFLRSSRSEDFRTEAGQKKAAEILDKHGIGALVPIGGDGTFNGAAALSKQWDGQIVGCPGTIDNDLKGTDYTIGFSTAVQTAVEAVDKLRDTASSHDRMFLVEVMGRHSGYIAAYAAVATGADAVAIPETPTDYPKIIEHLKELRDAGKRSIIMIVAEGDEAGGCNEIAEKLAEHDCPYKTRTIVLGHLQRGGVPTPEDRRRATQMGSGAIAAINRGENGVMIGTQDDKCISTPFEETFSSHRPIPQHLLDLLNEMNSHC